MVQGGAGDLNRAVLTALRAVTGVLSAVLLAYVLACALCSLNAAAASLCARIGR